jgi:putative AlgH/UPF0301 family transcriptional regulator
MLTNKILVSRRQAVRIGRQDELFVVFVFVHNHRGAVGAILNGHKVSSLSGTHLKDILNSPEGLFPTCKEMLLEKKFKDVPLWYGGPSKTEGIYFLHGYEQFSKATKREFDPDADCDASSLWNVMDGVYFGNPFTFGHIVEAGMFNDAKHRFFTGQCKWNATQLETEVDSGHWDILDPRPEMFFDLDYCSKLLPSSDPFKPSFN